MYLRADSLSHCRSNKFQGRRLNRWEAACPFRTDRYDPRIDPYGTSSNLVNGLITAKLFPRDYPLRADFSTLSTPKIERERERPRMEGGGRVGGSEWFIYGRSLTILTLRPELDKAYLFHIVS